MCYRCPTCFSYEYGKLLSKLLTSICSPNIPCKYHHIPETFTMIYDYHSKSKFTTRTIQCSYIIQNIILQISLLLSVQSTFLLLILSSGSENEPNLHFLFIILHLNKVRLDTCLRASLQYMLSLPDIIELCQTCRNSSRRFSLAKDN